MQAIYEFGANLGQQNKFQTNQVYIKSLSQKQIKLIVPYFPNWS